LAIDGYLGSKADFLLPPELSRTGEVHMISPSMDRRSTSRMSRIGVIIAVCFAAAVVARAQAIGNPREGLKVARAMCAECHLVDKVPGRSPNAAAPAFESIANVSGMTSAALIAALSTSHETMPNVIIKGSDMNDIVAYILSLKDRD
jgi:mono/diheme cytochrome c family protein